MQVQTVRIVSDVTEENPNGYIVINKDDFVEDQDELFLTEEKKPLLLPLPRVAAARLLVRPRFPKPP